MGSVHYIHHYNEEVRKLPLVSTQPEKKVKTLIWSRVPRIPLIIITMIVTAVICHKLHI